MDARSVRCALEQVHLALDLRLPPGARGGIEHQHVWQHLQQADIKEWMKHSKQMMTSSPGA